MASSLVIAGPFVILWVPYITFRSVRAVVSLTIPTSTGFTSTPHWWHITHAVVVSFTKLSATIAVTSCPVWVTPSSTTPLSAHMATRAFFPRFTFSSPVIPTICVIKSSIFPRECKGLAMLSHRLLAVFIFSSFRGFICLSVSSNVMISSHW